MNSYELTPGLERLLEHQGLFQDKYRLKRRLGAGSFATVIHAEHEAMGREVALKFLRPDVTKAHPEVAERFLTEVQLASRLTSPCTVTIFDFGETEEGIPFMVLEYVKGKPLDEAIKRYGALGLKRSIRIVLQILESLEEAHANRIIHRDLKPANIMVGKGGANQKLQIKVLDFGVAKLVKGAEESITTSSGRQSTQFIGTPRYMSPEQILGQEVTPASDLYSLGLILYEMATGEASLASDNVAKVARYHLDEAPLPLEALHKLPRPIQAIIERATARNVEDRYQDAAAFREALEAAIARGKQKSRRARATAPEGPSGTREQGPKSARKQDRDPRKNSEVFSGKGYVALPEESEAQGGRTPSVSEIRPPTPSPPQVGRHPSPVGASRRGTASTQPVASSARGKNRDLELDLDVVEEQRRELRRRRGGVEVEDLNRQAEKSQARQDLRLRIGCAVALVTTSLISFVIVSGSLSSLGTSMRLIAGLLPLLLSLLWSVFSENAYPDLLRRRIVPWTKRSALILPLAVVALMVLMPLAAQESLTTDGLWFLAHMPDGPLVELVTGPFSAICDGAAWLMGKAARILPWVR